MENNKGEFLKYDLDVISVELKRSADLLNCFLEFCDEECHLGDGKSFNDEAYHAITFVQRMDTFRSLVDMAHQTLVKEQEKLEKLFEMQESARVVA